ncbi:glycosyltransferase [Microbacter sp. GSS18]|nr:glycosyltransferase [Microbacter sp. GSS18]
MPPARVSVVIATNRGGPYLREAITSVRAQTTPVVEIVIVDDGSPDPDEVRALGADLGARVLRHPPAGVSAARNHGARHTSGEWIAFLDDDDVWHPHKIEAQLAAIDGAPDAVACAAGIWIIDQAGAPSGQEWGAPVHDRVDMLRGVAALPRIAGLLVRRAAFDEVGGFDTRFAHAEDIELMLRLLQVGRFTAVDRALTGYRRHDANTSGGPEDISGHLRALRHQVGHTKRRRDAAHADLLRENLARFRAAIAEGLASSVLAGLRRGHWHRAAVEAGRGLRWAPADFLRATARRAARFAARGPQPIENAAASERG